jgi:hypothetical protein
MTLAVKRRNAFSLSRTMWGYATLKDLKVVALRKPLYRAGRSGCICSTGNRTASTEVGYTMNGKHSGMDDELIDRSEL